MNNKFVAVLLAIAIIAVLCVGLFFVLDAIITDRDPVVGTMTVTTAEETITPLSKEIYKTTDNVRTDFDRLVLKDVILDLPVITYDSSITGRFEGGSKNGSFYFTVYDDTGKIYSDKKAFLDIPEQPGTYVILTETYWGSERYNRGTEYLYKLKIA